MSLFELVEGGAAVLKPAREFAPLDHVMARIVVERASRHTEVCRSFGVVLPGILTCRWRAYGGIGRRLRCLKVGVSRRQFLKQFQNGFGMFRQEEYASYEFHGRDSLPLIGLRIQAAFGFAFNRNLPTHSPSSSLVIHANSRGFRMLLIARHSLSFFSSQFYLCFLNRATGVVWVFFVA
jgi:hypothetical protein